jgi:hypothetical protein
MLHNASLPEFLFPDQCSLNVVLEKVGDKTMVSGITRLQSQALSAGNLILAADFIIP